MSRTTLAVAIASAFAALVLVPAAAASPISLLLPQSNAFSILGASCGGIQEQAYATGFDPVSGYPTGAVYLSTRCGGSGRGGGYHVTTYSAWASVTWTYAGAVSSYAKLAAAPAVDPAFSATDAYGDQLYNSLGHAWLDVPVPAAPGGLTAVQAGAQLQVAWTPDAATAPVLSSATVTATPVGSTAPVLTSTVAGTATSALVGPVQPLTTYLVTVTSTDAGGTSPASDPVTVTTGAASVAPSAPTGVKARWTAPDQPGDALAVSWVAAVPGDAPVDQYQVTLTGRGDSAGQSFTQTVPGTSLAASFVVADTSGWSVQVQAHNAVGWGPLSASVRISGV